MLQNLIDELNLLQLNETSKLYEFRYRIIKYTNACLQNQLNINEFDELLNDFNGIKSTLSGDDIQKSDTIWQLKENIKKELSK